MDIINTFFTDIYYSHEIYELSYVKFEKNPQNKTKGVIISFNLKLINIVNFIVYRCHH